MGEPMAGWELFTRWADGGFVNCKVVATRPVEKKANYWWSFYSRTGALRLPRDFAIMREERPDLHAAVEELIREVYFD